MPEDSAGVGELSRSSCTGSGGGGGLAFSAGTGGGGGGLAVSLPMSPSGGEKISAEALAPGGGSETDAAFGETGACGGGAFCIGLAFSGTAFAAAREVLELVPAEAPPAAAVEELAPAEALLYRSTRPAMTGGNSHLPGQAASGFCQSGAKGCRP